MKYLVKLEYEINDCRDCPFTRTYRIMEHVNHDEFKLSQITGIEQQIVECGIKNETIKNFIKPFSKDCPLKRNQED